MSTSAPPGASATSLVAAKLAVPALPERLVARPRLEAGLQELLDGKRVVRVSATAGAGKTTAVVQGVIGAGRPVAWLTVDDTDVVAGRLLVYLEAAIRQAVPGIRPVVEPAMGSGVLHPEAAALLADAVGSRPAIVVFDELERLAEAPASLAVVSGFVRYAPPSLTIVLISRREVQIDALARMDVEAIGHLDEQSLAFTTDEAAEALALRGNEAIDASSVVTATGGWVTGVLFDAWRSRHHVGGSGGESDPLYGYLTAEILAKLADDEQEFLVVTSLLSEVDADRARALGVEGASALLAALRVRHLPVVWAQDGQVMRCHPRFREYLRALLDRRGAASLAGLRQRFARTLAAEGRREEAVDVLLEAGAVAEAAAEAVAVLPAVIARLDFDLAERWLDRFRREGPLEEPELLLAQLSVAVGREDFERAVHAADALLEAGGSVSRHRALAAWSYWHVGRVDSVRALMAEPGDDRDAEMARWMFSLMDPDPPPAVPPSTGGPLDALLLRIAYARGRLTEVRDAPLSGSTRAAAERIAACRALGELDRTRELLEIAGREVHLSNLRLEGTVRAELLIDLGREREAREALARGQERIARSGSLVFDMVLRLLAAKLELRLCRDARRALEILGGLEAIEVLRDYGYLAEQVDLWVGYAHLLSGRDAEALVRLRAAVGSMSKADRLLELPTAAVYLSEAEWRAEHTAEADAAADLALEAAGRQGSRHLLLQALADVPMVSARRLDLEASADGPWHDIARALALRERAPARPVRARLRLQDFGTPTLMVDGEPVRTRIAKSYGLLAVLISAGRRVSRRELLDALFDGREDDSARSYLRQATLGLRRVLPEGLELLGTDEGFALSDPSCAESHSQLLTIGLADAARLTGIERIEGIVRALALGASGEFLEGVDSSWADERRAELERLVGDARLDLSVAAFETGAYDLADRTLEDLVVEDPLRERAWRLLMRVAAARGREDDLIPIYRRCEAALTEVGLEPAESTRRLLAGLRR